MTKVSRNMFLFLLFIKRILIDSLIDWLTSNDSRTYFVFQLLSLKFFCILCYLAKVIDKSNWNTFWNVFCNYYYPSERVKKEWALKKSSSAFWDPSAPIIRWHKSNNLVLGGQRERAAFKCHQVVSFDTYWESLIKKNGFSHVTSNRRCSSAYLTNEAQCRRVVAAHCFYCNRLEHVWFWQTFTFLDLTIGRLRSKRPIVRSRNT